MKLGLHLPQVGIAATAEHLAQIARRAEAEGYSSLWVSDHIVVPVAGSPLPSVEMLEPVTTLAYVAAVTKTIRLATSVLVVPYRNPFHLAKELATLDRLCQGRLTVGLASGWLEREFRVLGAHWERRGEYTDEAIRLMRTLWRSEIPEFKGEFFSISEMRFGPRPPSGTIPIWIGGLSKRAARRAIELGDGWHGSRMRPEQVAERLGWLREIAQRTQRSLNGFALSHRVYLGFAERWTETGGYIEGILAPPEALADYLNQYAQLGIEELLITPIAADKETLGRFLDRFDREVRPRIGSVSHAG
jgi:probable F420-dependent oxidoreductase